ncbi:IS4 family transposase [Myroides marinus]|uniref:IS4 family transposase n=1 Tax=Myroides marinus TaxID=703342 RepID=UPI00257612C1|nr:IS4 family transposase [Myroides marinus]
MEWVSRLIFALIPTEESYVLVMDRTNWKFGKQDINILMLGISYKNMCFPILFKMLDKRGNSNTNERKELINTFVEWFGKDCTRCVLADREFVGEDWISYLNDRQIKYYIRIRNNFKVYLPSKQKEITASHLFNNLKPGQTRQYHKIVRIHNQLCYISGTKVITDGKIDFCIIIGFNKPEKALDTYKIRWQIETLFKAFKSSGFNIEDTHLQKIDRLEKLVMLVMIAFVWCYKIGDYIEAIKPITIKNHGNRLISVFKLGLDYLSRLLLSKNGHNPLNINCFRFCRVLSSFC